MPKVVVEVEEELYAYRPADNGAGPMWCRGNSCIARVGDEVYATGLETLEGAKPLHNCVPFLMRRTARGWEERWRHEERTREPSPIGCMRDGSVLVSLNPTRAPVDAYSGPAEPLVARFAPGARGRPELLRPAWSGKPEFTEHSYRSFAVDGARGELVLFQNVGMSHAEYAFRDESGAWASSGSLAWPWGAGYDVPQPVRTCYPAVQLSDRAVHFLGVSDVVEPYETWRSFKRELTGQKWDYDFRRLFYTWSDDIRSGRFHLWREIASRDATCGWVTPCDLHVDGSGLVFVLWAERALDDRLRERFFPLERQEHLLSYAVLRDGSVLFRQALAAAGPDGPVSDFGRFHVGSDGRLFVLAHESKPGGPSRNRLRELSASGAVGDWCDVPLRVPLASFFTATVRGGSAPSDALEVLGEAAHTMRYARILVRP